MMITKHKATTKATEGTEDEFLVFGPRQTQRKRPDKTNQPNPSKPNWTKLNHNQNIIEPREVTPCPCPCHRPRPRWGTQAQPKFESGKWNGILRNGVAGTAAVAATAVSAAKGTTPQVRSRNLESRKTNSCCRLRKTEKQVNSLRQVTCRLRTRTGRVGSGRVWYGSHQVGTGRGSWRAVTGNSYVISGEIAGVGIGAAATLMSSSNGPRVPSRYALSRCLSAQGTTLPYKYCQPRPRSVCFLGPDSTGSA